MSELLNIQRGYFEIIKKYFGHFYNEAKRTGSSAMDVAKDVMRHPRIGKLINSNIDQTFGLEIKEYWNKNYEALMKEMNSFSGLKLYYSGDLSPINSGIVNRLGLYADTIIIPDPTLRCLGDVVTDITKPHVRNYLLIKTAIKILEYESIVLAKIYQPMALIFPSEILLKDKKIGEKLIPKSFEKTVDFLNENMHRKLDDFDSWEECFKKIKSYEELGKEIKNKQAFLFDSNIDKNDYKKQIDSIILYNKKFIKDDADQILGKGFDLIPGQIMGRMGQSLWHISKSEILSSFPVQDAYVSWHYLRWQIQKERMLGKKELVPSCLLKENFKMLGNVPLDILIKLREAGELQDLRNCINREINTESNNTTEDAIKQIQYNFKNELIKHEKKVEELDSKFRKSLKSDIPSMIIGLGIGVLGASVNPLLGLPGIALGGSNLWSIAEKKDEKDLKKLELKNSFWGFFANEVKK